MDNTPERNQIGTPISKFEDSPVFNYLNSLSPINPVKSIHVAQSFNSLSFPSPPSVFTSPHVSSHKESRFLRRHHFLDQSKPDFSSLNENEGSANVGNLDTVQLSDCSADLQESINPRSSIRETTNEATSELSRLAVELPLTLKYDSGSPDCNPMCCHGLKTDPLSKLAGTPESLFHFNQEVSVESRHSFESEVNFQGICQIEQIKEEGTGSEWDELSYDAADQLVSNSANHAEVFKGDDPKLVNPGTSSFISVVLEPPQDDIDDVQKAQTASLAGSCEQYEMENFAAQPGDTGQQKETDQTPNIISSSSLDKQAACDPSEQMDDIVGNCIPFSFKTDSQHQRGMRRRCLVFEKAAANKKNLESDSSSSSSISSQPDEKIASDDKQLAPVKSGSSSTCVLPGIGLHLNALTTTLKDCRAVKNETTVSGTGRQLLRMPSSISSFECLKSGQKPLYRSLIVNSMDRDIVSSDSGVQATQEASQASSFEVNKEFNQSSPKKKRRRLEHAGEAEACKRCNCKKSKCLKLYCECFAAGIYCIEPCSCQDCFNTPIHEDTVLAARTQIESRNPLAFAPKVIRSIVPVPEVGEESSTTPASARHKRGCNCKKSSCLKKYCECFQGGVKCSINCRCEGCKNAFGRKDGSVLIGTEEDEPEEGETEACEKSAVDKSLQTNEGHKYEEQQYPDLVLSITPSFQSCRLLVQQPFSSGSKPPRSSLLTIGLSPHLHAGHSLTKPDILHPQPKFEKRFKMIQDNETPEILKGNCSSVSGIQTTSPNSKRISPPLGELGSSSGRKLILQSIPSFPSLTPHLESRDFSGKFK